MKNYIPPSELELPVLRSALENSYFERLTKKIKNFFFSLSTCRWFLPIKKTKGSRLNQKLAHLRKGENL
jgi:hypothetical protein